VAGRTAAVQAAIQGGARVSGNRVFFGAQGGSRFITDPGFANPSRYGGPYSSFDVGFGSNRRDTDGERIQRDPVTGQIIGRG
jgi:hypothetical protein